MEVLHGVVAFVQIVNDGGQLAGAGATTSHGRSHLHAPQEGAEIENQEAAELAAKHLNLPIELLQKVGFSGSQGCAQKKPSSRAQPTSP
jgi:hypothetical protein